VKATQIQEGSDIFQGVEHTTFGGGWIKPQPEQRSGPFMLNLTTYSVFCLMR